MTETPKKPEIDKWGGVLSFGRGRKRLIIALCALLLMIGAFCIAFVIKWGKTDEVIFYKILSDIMQQLYLKSKPSFAFHY